MFQWHRIRRCGDVFVHVFVHVFVVQLWRFFLVIVKIVSVKKITKSQKTGSLIKKK